MSSRLLKIFSFAVLASLSTTMLGGCLTTNTMGNADTPVSGGAGPEGSTGKTTAKLEHCDRPLGIIALVESQDNTMMQMLQVMNLGSPNQALKLIIAQSGCFQIVDRGAAMQTIQQERALSASGETRSGSNMGKGQMVAADLALTPNVLWSGKTGGMGGGLAGLGGAFGPVGLIAGAVAGSMSESSAQVMLTVTDVRSSMQVSVAEGNAVSQDFNIGGILGGGAGLAGLGGYGSTPEGKTVMTAMVDAYNNVVRSVRSMPPLPSLSSKPRKGSK